METIYLNSPTSFPSDMMYTIMEYIHEHPKNYWTQEFKVNNTYLSISRYGNGLPDIIEDYLYDTKEGFEMYTPYMGVLRLFTGTILKIDNVYYFLSDNAPGTNIDRSIDVIHAYKSQYKDSWTSSYIPR